MKPTSVLFVCLGNICRSPTAEGVFRNLVDAQGLSDTILIDSAGTSGWHIGKSPDERTIEAAAHRGYDLSSLRGRQSKREDFSRFEYILAMDESNLADLEAIKPASYEGHLGLFLSFAQSSNYLEVPDPYYGGAKGFDLVLDLVEEAAEGLLAHIRQQ